MDYRDYIREKKIDLSKPNLRRELSNLITEARLYSGFSQSELAKAMETTQSSIARAEGGEMQPSVEFLERVAKAVGTTLIYPKFAFMVEREVNAAANTFAAIGGAHFVLCIGQKHNPVVEAPKESPSWYSRYSVAEKPQYLEAPVSA